MRWLVVIGIAVLVVACGDQGGGPQLTDQHPLPDKCVPGWQVWCSDCASGVGTCTTRYGDCVCNLEPVSMGEIQEDVLEMQEAVEGTPGEIEESTGE